MRDATVGDAAESGGDKRFMEIGFHFSFELLIGAITENKTRVYHEIEVSLYLWIRKLDCTVICQSSETLA